jgi:hypothetical protein
MNLSHEKMFNREFIDATKDFLKSCLCMSPYRKFVDQFESIKIAEDLDNLLHDSLAEFSSDLKRWNWEYKNAGDLYERLMLAPNLQVPFFYRISRTFFVNRLETLADVIAVLARWMKVQSSVRTAKLAITLRYFKG